MAEIIRLRRSPHEQTQELLPWYINGTLDAGETAVVDAHLPECAECRADLSAERAMARELANLSLETGQGWAAMSRRLDAEQARTEPALAATAAKPLPRERPAGNAGSHAGRFSQRRVAIGWLSGASALAASLAAVLVAITLPGVSAPTYRALGQAPAARPANVVVMFQPAIREADMRNALLTAHAQLVGGPTASGGYLLHVMPGDRASILEKLRSTPQVTLAQPVDVAPLEPGASQGSPRPPSAP